MPNWDKTKGMELPFLTAQIPNHELYNEGDRRIKVCVEFPVFGNEGELTHAESEEVKPKGFKATK